MTPLTLLRSFVIGLCILTSPALTTSVAHAQILESGGTALSGCRTTTINERGEKVCVSEQISLSECVKDGSCGVGHFIILIDAIIRWAAGIAGVVALFTFVMGGMWMIFSAGNSSRVDRGKEIVKGSTVALFWILGSWLLISFVLTALNVQQALPLKPSPCQTLGEGKRCGAENEICYLGQCLDKCKILEMKAGSGAVDTFQCTTWERCVPKPANKDACQAPLCQQGACTDSELVCCKVR